MFKVNIYKPSHISHKTYWDLSKEEKEKVIMNYDKTFLLETKEEAYLQVTQQLVELLSRVNNDFTQLAKVRIVIWNNEQKLESVNFKLADNGQLGVFVNWASLPNISAEMWGVWTAINNLLVDNMEVA